MFKSFKRISFPQYREQRSWPSRALPSCPRWREHCHIVVLPLPACLESACKRSSRSGVGCSVASPASSDLVANCARGSYPSGHRWCALGIQTHSGTFLSLPAKETTIWFKSHKDIERIRQNFTNFFCCAHIMTWYGTAWTIFCRDKVVLWTFV